MKKNKAFISLSCYSQICYHSNMKADNETHVIIAIIVTCMIHEVIDYNNTLVNQLTADKQESKNGVSMALSPNFTFWCPLPKISI